MCMLHIFLLLFFSSTPVRISFRFTFTFTRRSDPRFVRRPVRDDPNPPKLPNPPKPPKLPKISPNCEKISSIDIPPPKPLPVVPLTPACPNRSYRARLSVSLKTSYASAASLNRSSAFLFPGFLSG